MVLGLVMAAVVVAQGGEIDGIQARRILEASRAADYWAYDQVHTRLVPDVSIVQSTGAARVRRKAFQDACLRDMRNAAYEQVCDAYHVSKKQFNAIVRNPQRAMAFDYVPDVRDRRRFFSQMEPWQRGTLFDPRNVRLKESVAERYGYINPRKPEPPTPSLALEQLIGPSPLPRECTEPKVDKPKEPKELTVIPNWFNGTPEAWAAHEKRRREFAKRAGIRDYRVPGGNSLD